MFQQPALDLGLGLRFRTRVFELPTIT